MTALDSGFVSFLAIAAVVIVTPGQDTALTIRSTLLGGRGAGIATAAGVAGGQLVWTVAAAAGVTAVLMASEPVFAAIRLGGAAYLVYLGASSLWSALRGSSHGWPGPGDPGGARLLRHRAFRQGLLSNLGNPKMVVFFSSLLPQFAPSEGPAFGTMLGLGLVFCSMTLLWLTCYAWLVARARRVLRRPAVPRVLDAVTGTVLVAFGLRVAAEPT